MRASRTAGRSALVVVAVAAVVALVADASAAPSGATRAAIEIVAGPKVQTLDTKVVTTRDARTGARTRTLVFGTARFTITVTNPSAVRLAGVTVADPLSPACDRRLGTLGPGGSLSYSCSVPNVARSYTNVATASGRPTAFRGLTGARALVTASAASVVRVRTQVTAHTGVPNFTG